MCVCVCLCVCIYVCVCVCMCVCVCVWFTRFLQGLQGLQGLNLIIAPLSLSVIIYKTFTKQYKLTVFLFPNLLTFHHKFDISLNSKFRPFNILVQYVHFNCLIKFLTTSSQNSLI